MPKQGVMPLPRDTPTLPTDASPADPTRLHVMAGGRRIALAFRSVREFGEVGRHVPVPGAAAWCLGLVQWRGRLLTLLDGGRLFGTEPSRPRYQVVLSLPDIETALAVDGFVDLCGEDAPCDVLLEDDALRGLDALQPGAAGQAP